MDPFPASTSDIPKKGSDDYPDTYFDTGPTGTPYWQADFLPPTETGKKYQITLVRIFNRRASSSYIGTELGGALIQVG